MSGALARPVVLIEPDAGRVGAHWTQAAAVLTAAAVRAGHPVTVLALGGMPTAAATMLTAGGAQVVTVRPAGDPTAVRLWKASRTLRRAALTAVRRTRRRRWPHQLTAAARTLAEAAALRTARTVAGPRAALIVLSASDALHTTAAALGAAAHLRVVHELATTEDLPLRVLGWWVGRQWSHRVLLVCPTDAVRADLRVRFPDLTAAVRPFALADADPPLTSGDRAAARAAYGLGAGDVAVALVGGWWAHKDMTTVAAALPLLRRRLHLIVAGDPVDAALLARMRTAPSVRLHEHVGDLPRTVVRQAYAAADATVVARRVGVGKESGLVADAVVLEVPLIVSDHDPALTAALAGQPWARTFPTGDPYALAAVLDQLHTTAPARPDATAAAVLGLAGAATALADYLHLIDAIHPTEPQ